MTTNDPCVTWSHTPFTSPSLSHSSLLFMLSLLLSSIFSTFFYFTCLVLSVLSRNRLHPTLLAFYSSSLKDLHPCQLQLNHSAEKEKRETRILSVRASFTLSLRCVSPFFSSASPPTSSLVFFSLRNFPPSIDILLFVLLLLPSLSSWGRI